MSSIVAICGRETGNMSRTPGARYPTGRLAEYINSDHCPSSSVATLNVSFASTDLDQHILAGEIATTIVTTSHSVRLCPRPDAISMRTGAASRISI